MLTPQATEELTDLTQLIQELVEDLLRYTSGDHVLVVPSLSAAVRIEHNARSIIERLVTEDIRNGASWAAVAAVLGTTRQAAHQRYGHLVPLD